jgi:hypothetical protein
LRSIDDGSDLIKKDHWNPILHGWFILVLLRVFNENNAPALLKERETAPSGGKGRRFPSIHYRQVLLSH